MARSSARESVIERAVRILDVFGPDKPAASVTEVARRAGLPLSTASRLVDELVAHGLLRRDSARRICVGVRLWELASRASPTRGLRDAAMPFMEDLHVVVGHHVQLGVLQGYEVLFIERLSAPGSVVNLSHIATRLPLHLSSSGLVLLAHAPRVVQERALSGRLAGHARDTITDPARLRMFLADVRQTGFALCPGFMHGDATGIAVPLRDPADRVIAALSVVVPNDERASSHIGALQAASRGIRRFMMMPGGFPRGSE